MVDVSIIIPMKNAEKYIEKCLNSLLCMRSESFSYEIIIVDDCSTDNSRIIVQDYLTKTNKIILTDGAGSGLGDARCVGLKCASGKYIGWVDADDYIDPEMFEMLYCAIKQQSAQIALCDYDFFPNKPKRKKKWFRAINGQAVPQTVERNTQLWNKLFSKDFLDKTCFLELMRNCSDGACAILLVMADKVITVNQILYHYRVGHSSLSASYSNVDKYIKNVSLTKAQKVAIQNLGSDKIWLDYFDYRIIYSLFQLVLIAGKNRRHDVFLEAFNELKKIDYMTNPFLDSILRENHGFIQAFVLSRVITHSWNMAKIVGAIL